MNTVLPDYKNLGMIKILFIVSGVLNLLTAVSWLLLTILGTITTVILGCGGFIITAIVTAACIFDFICYNRLNKMNKTGTLKTIQLAAVLDLLAVFSLNVTSAVFAIIIFIKLSKHETKLELSQSGIT